jgi:hypothetical protein
MPSGAKIPLPEKVDMAPAVVIRPMLSLVTNHSDRSGPTVTEVGMPAEMLFER